MPTPKRDTRALSRLRRFMRTPRTIAQIRAQFGLTERTAYRWLRYLEDRGAGIYTRRGAGRAWRYGV